MRLLIFALTTFVFVYTLPCRAEYVSEYKEKATIVPEMEAYINTLMEQYSENQIRDLVKKLNEADINYAKKNNLPMPVILSEKSLQDEKALRNYLRNHFGYTM